MPMNKYDTINPDDKHGLLIPGWAGELGDDEMDYVKEKLKGSPTLRRLWHIRVGKTGRIIGGDRIIQERALDEFKYR